jgi:hypothetical protein
MSRASSLVSIVLAVSFFCVAGVVMLTALLCASGLIQFVVVQMC